MFRAYGSSPVDASTPWGLNFSNVPKGNLKNIRVYIIACFDDKFCHFARHLHPNCQHLSRLRKNS